MINNFLVGGVERLLSDIISFIDKDKFDIKIVTVVGSGPLESSFRNLGAPIYFAGPSHFFSDKLFKIWWVFISPLILLRLVFFMLKSKPDVVVSSLYQADVLSMIASKIVGVKQRILVQLDVIQFGKFKYFLKKIFALRFSTGIVSGSGTIKNFLVEYFGIKNEKITLIYNGINYERFEKKRNLVFNLNSPTIGVVGRLEEVKGHIYLLEALKILKDKNSLCPDVFLAGDGASRGILKKYVIENNLKFVKFLGNVHDVPDFFSKIDILVIPSLSEGFGLVVIEGMVSGKIVIASDIKAMQELIKNGQTGLLFKSQNPDSLADILLKVLNDKEIFKKLQNGALSFAEENKKLFDVQEVSKSYQKLFVVC